MRIEELDDWRGAMLARPRALIKAADPEIVEAWKWRGVPVWEHDGIVCTRETHKSVVKTTFAKGAALADPARLFNASIEKNARRAIDLREGATIDEAALEALVRAAVALNSRLLYCLLFLIVRICGIYYLFVRAYTELIHSSKGCFVGSNEYRLFFLDGRAGIQARHEFLAENDAEAKMLAALLFDACSDICAGYELWNYARQIVSTRTGLGMSGRPLTPESISEEWQRYLLDLEEAFRRSHWRLAKSTRLLEASDLLRKALASSKRPL